MQKHDLPGTRSAVLISITLLGLLSLAHAAPDDREPREDRDAITYGLVVDKDAALDVEALLVVWSQRLGVPIFTDPQLHGSKIKLDNTTGPLTWGVFRAVLDFNDVLVEERLAAGGRSALFAYPRRNAPNRSGGPTRVIVISPGAPIDSMAWALAGTAAAVSSAQPPIAR